jgi:transcriptional regulator of acetoin/glycerol metabolism
MELRDQWIAPHERQYLVDLLSECQGRVREAADRAGVNHVTMYRLMKKHGLTLKRAVG